MLTMLRLSMLTLLLFSAFLVVLTTNYPKMDLAKEYIYTSYVWVEILVFTFIFISCIVYEPEPDEIKVELVEEVSLESRVQLFLNSLLTFLKSALIFILTPTFAIYIHLTGVEQYLSSVVFYQVDLYETLLLVLEQFLKGAMWDFLEVVQFNMSAVSIDESSWHTHVVFGLYRSIMGVYFILSIKHTFGINFRAPARR